MCPVSHGLEKWVAGLHKVEGTWEFAKASSGGSGTPSPPPRAPLIYCLGARLLHRAPSPKARGRLAHPPPRHPLLTPEEVSLNPAHVTPAGPMSGGGR